MIPLFPIPLSGSGTKDVESFPSYIHRTAVDHGVYVGEMLRHLDRTVRPEVDHSDLDSLPELPNYMHVPELVRPSRTTNMLVRFMEISTRQHLKQSTLWFLDSVLGRSVDEVLKTFRWCPECIQEMELSGQEPYFKLIWHLNAVTECPSHGTPFLTKCAHCDSNQDSYIRQHPINICSVCNSNIRVRKSPLVHTQIVNSWNRHGKDLCRLMGDLASMDVMELPKDGVKQSLNLVFEHYWKEGREQELYSILPRDPLVGLLDSDRAVSLKIARRFAYRLGISIFELMCGQAHQTSAVLNSRWVCQLPPDFMEKQHKQKRDHVVIIKKIQSVRCNTNTPLSLSKIALLVGVSVGYLEYRFPSLVRQIVDEHQQFLKDERHKTLQRAQLVAMRFFFDEQHNCAPKSRKEAYRVLRNETGLPKFVLRRAIQDAYRVLNE